MFTIYSAEWCGYCQKAKQLLKEYNFKDIKVLDIEDDPVNRQTLKALDLKTIPQIWHDGIHVGGYDDLVEYLKDGT